MRTWLFVGLLALGVFLFGLIALSLTALPQGAGRVYPIIPQPITTVETTTTTFVTTTSTTTTSTTTTEPANTTTPAIIIPLSIVCPPNITVSLGSSLNPAVTGLAVATSTNQPGCGSTIVIYSDNVVGTIARSQGSHYQAERIAPKEHTGIEIPSVLHQENSLPNKDARASPSPSLDGKRRSGQRDILKNKFMKKRYGRKSARSPSYAASNIVVDTNAASIAYTGSPASDHNSAASATEIVGVTNTPAGSYYFVMDTTLTTILAQFDASQSFASPTSNCAVSLGQGTVTWDQSAQRWLLMEIGANNTLCLYVSLTVSALGAWNSYAFSFGATNPDYPKLGVWGATTYTITINVPTGIGNMCVLDRLAVLSAAVSPSLFCGTSINGILAGFTFQSWTPASDVYGTLTESIASAGTGTASSLFMRHHDDELHDGATTPLFDWIDVELWTNINFTTSSYISLRYPITIKDFDSSYANCPATDACIDTPNPAVFLDPMREVIMNRLTYRNGFIVGSYVSHANGIDTARVRWFELIFASPTFFLLQQDGVLPFADGINRWMSTITKDGQGTVALGYSISSFTPTVWPGLAATTRLASDPTDGMRDEVIVSVGGLLGTTISTGSAWGYYGSITASASATRYFYFSGQVTGINWRLYTYRLRITGSIIQRTFTAEDTCNSTSCVQQIIEQ